jgi:hypothetical protein
VGKMALNSFLMTGPDFYNQLVLVLLNQRLFAVAVTGDIREMFHHVAICKEDQPAQRFLWRDCVTSVKPDVWQMVRMIFGGKSSPFCAQWTKNRNAERHKDQHPEAWEAITKFHYVDDYIQSFQSEDEAIRIAEDVRRVHLKGGFELRNFVSNSTKVRRALNGETEGDDVKTLINLDKEGTGQEVTEKVLGVHWNTATDEFVFKTSYLERLKIDPDGNPTKREFLRILMSIYDPFGYLANYIVHGKILNQDIWASRIEWDQRLEAGEKEKYGEWIRNLPKIQEFRMLLPANEVWSRM